VATIAEIRDQSWSLNPGRYVGLEQIGGKSVDFLSYLGKASEQLAALFSESNELEKNIMKNISALMNDADGD